MHAAISFRNRGVTMTVPVPKVFISYAHESAEHMARVRALAEFLRETGLEVVLDVWSAGGRQDWYAWAIKEMTSADFVLVVASARYAVTGDGSGPNTGNRGVQSEAALLRELVYADRDLWMSKILPVVLPGQTVDQIPLFLQPYTASHFLVDAIDAIGTEELLRVIEGRPAPEVVGPRSFSPSVGVAGERAEVVNQITGKVTGNVVQAGSISGNLTFGAESG